MLRWSDLHGKRKMRSHPLAHPLAQQQQSPEENMISGRRFPVSRGVMLNTKLYDAKSLERMLRHDAYPSTHWAGWRSATNDHGNPRALTRDEHHAMQVYNAQHAQKSKVPHSRRELTANEIRDIMTKAGMHMMRGRSGLGQTHRAYMPSSGLATVAHIMELVHAVDAQMRAAALNETWVTTMFPHGMPKVKVENRLPRSSHDPSHGVGIYLVDHILFGTDTTRGWRADVAGHMRENAMRLPRTGPRHRRSRTSTYEATKKAMNGFTGRVVHVMTAFANNTREVAASHLAKVDIVQATRWIRALPPGAVFQNMLHYYDEPNTQEY